MENSVNVQKSHQSLDFGSLKDVLIMGTILTDKI